MQRPAGILKIFRNCHICWSCKYKNTDCKLLAFCEQCNVIQKPNRKMNYFEIFDQEKKFEIDINKVNEKYRKLIMTLHPDKFSISPQSIQELSHEFTELIQKAQLTLKDPYLRACYLYSLMDENKSIFDYDDSVHMKDFLLILFEINESVSEGDSSPELIQDIKTQIDNCFINISELFKNGDLVELRCEIKKIRYLQNILDTLK